MSHKDKVTHSLKALIDQVFDIEDKELKIDAISTSFRIAYHIKGKSKFMQNMMCNLPHECKGQINRLKVIVDDFNKENIINVEQAVMLSDIGKDKIKKTYGMALVNPKKLAKDIKNLLVRKAILTSRVESNDELLEYYKNFCENKCTKLIQTNNTISCKIGNLSQGKEILADNLLTVFSFLQEKHFIIKKVILLLHNTKKVKMFI